MVRIYGKNIPRISKDFFFTRDLPSSQGDLRRQFITILCDTWDDSPSNKLTNAGI